MAAHFESSRQALVAAKRIQTSILEFLACRPGEQGWGRSSDLSAEDGGPGGLQRRDGAAGAGTGETGSDPAGGERLQRLRDLPGIDVQHRFPRKDNDPETGHRRVDGVGVDDAGATRPFAGVRTAIRPSHKAETVRRGRDRDRSILPLRAEGRCKRSCAAGDADRRLRHRGMAQKPVLGNPARSLHHAPSRVGFSKNSGTARAVPSPKGLTSSKSGHRSRAPGSSWAWSRWFWWRR